MGINELWDFLRAKCPEVFETVPMSSFSGKRIAIDAGQWMFPFRMTARKNVANRCDIVHAGIDEDEVDNAWFDRIIGELMFLFKHGITPICVFDGKAPPEKHNTRQKRREADAKKLTEINILRTQLKSMDKLRVKQSDTYKLRKLESQYRCIPDGSIAKMMAFLKNLGVPCLIGSDGIEAERLAAALVRTGVAAAGYTKDGDYQVHDGNIQIVGNGLSRTDENDQPIPVFNIIRTGKVLSSLYLTQPMFVDMCIFAGCDYNKKINRYMIRDIYRDISTKGCVENIQFTMKQEQQLPEVNIEACRRLFYPLPFNQMFDVSVFAEGLGVTPETITNEIAFNVNIDLGCLLEAMTDLKLDRYFTDLANLYANLPQPVNYYASEPELPGILVAAH